MLVRAVEALMEGKGGAEADQFALFDPKAPKGSAPGERARGAFREAMVFLVGGGCVLEHHALQEMAAAAGTVGQAGLEMAG